MPTFGTSLRGMPRVNLDYFETSRLSFVLDKGVQLSKAPTVQTSFVVNVLVLLASPHLGSFPDVGQVLRNNCRSWLCILNNALREDVIVISSLPKPLTRKLFQVPFSRFASLLLKLATDTEDAPFLFLPASFPQELTFGRHGPRVAQRDDDGKKQATKGEDLKPDTMTVSREGLSSQKQEKRWSEMWTERVESEEDQGESQNAALLRMLRARRDHSVI